MGEDFKLQRVPGSPRHFERIDIGCGVEVSIQASDSSYCEPRATYPSSDDYLAFEVAIFQFDRFYHPHTNEAFARRKWASYWSEHDEVGAYVPRQQVKEMLSDVRDFWGRANPGV